MPSVARIQIVASYVGFLAVAFLAAWPLRGAPESESERITNPYLDATVRVESAPGGNGFGFIVGERGEQVFVVTAGHVLGDDQPGAKPKVSLYFHHDPFTRLNAEVLRRPPGLDLALLRVSRPNGWSFRPGNACGQFAKEDPVWWIGRDGKWDVPVRNEAGLLRVSEPDATTDRIEFAASGVKPGVSGAPLIGAKGIVGMVVVDDNAVAEALAIEKIRRFVAQQEGAWSLAGCGELNVSLYPGKDPFEPSPDPANPSTNREPASCWSDWVHKKICQDTFKDGGSVQRMVMLKGESFTLGSDKGEPDEKPPRTVQIKDFAIGQYEVTRADFSRFVKNQNYRTEAETGGGCYTWDGKKRVWIKHAGLSWRNSGYQQTDTHPVVCVSWNDAQAYVAWLNRQTGGDRYGLPTEAEWEYAARAGSKAERFWGDGDLVKACKFANVGDQSSYRAYNWKPIFTCDDGAVNTSKSGRYAANDWGLYDVLGNASEWTCSGYENPYASKMETCSDDSEQHVLRGGAWGCGPDRVRSAYRYGLLSNYSTDQLGFRLARRK